MEALESNCPSCTIMPTIYDVKGLTFQQQLDDFWQHGSAPDSELYNALYDALAGTIQVRGTLYDPEGLRAAATAVADKLLTNSVNPHGAYVPVPPRMEKASKMGVLYQD
jgi:capsular polysaccharide export protein